MEISTVKRIDLFCSRRIRGRFNISIFLVIQIFIIINVISSICKEMGEMECRNAFVHLIKIKKEEINYLRSKGEYRKASDRVKDQSNYK